LLIQQQVTSLIERKLRVNASHLGFITVIVDLEQPLS